MQNVPQYKEVNESFISGRTADDAVVKFTRRGDPLATLTVVTQLDKHPEYHRCVAFSAEVVEQVSKLRKGTFVELSGRLQTRRWDDARSGLTREKTEILVLKLRVLAEAPAPLTPDYGQGDAR